MSLEGVRGGLEEKIGSKRSLPGPLDMLRCPTRHVQHLSTQNLNLDSTRGNLDMSRCPARHVQHPSVQKPKK